MTDKSENNGQSAGKGRPLDWETCMLILDTVVEGYWDWDVATDTAFLNRRMCLLIGYSSEETVFNSSFFFKVIHPDDVAAMGKFLGEYLAGERDESVAEFRMVRKDGSIIWVRERARVIARDAAGKPSRMIGSVIDITERKWAEKFREESMAQLEAMVAERTEALSHANQQLSREIEERLWAEEELLRNQRQLEALGFELSMAEERERGRIAGELHDQVGQCLILGKIKTSMLASLESRPEQKAIIEELEGLMDKTIEDVRSLTFQLRPPILAAAGLEAAIFWLAGELREQYGLLVDCLDDAQPKPLRYELRSYLFQAVRELLLNVVRHAGTDRARIGLQREGENIAIIVADDGVGFDIEAIPSKGVAAGFGLFNVQQRIEYLGGRFMVESASGQGCRITIVVPLDCC